MKYRNSHKNWMRIPTIPPSCSDGKRPPIPIDCAPSFRLIAPPFVPDESERSDAGASTVVCIYSLLWGEKSSGCSFSHGFSLECDDVGVVDESVQNGVGQGVVTDGFVPVFDGHLCGDKGGRPVIAVFHNLEEVFSFFIRQERSSPVVDDDEVCAQQGAQYAFVAAGGSGDGQFLEEPRGADVAHGEAPSAGLIAEGAGEVAFAHAGGSGNDAVFVAAQPVTFSEGLDEGLVQASGFAVVDVFDTGILAQFGLFEARLQAPGVLFGFLAVEQQGEAFIEAQCVVAAGFELFAVGVVHPGQPQPLQFVEGRIG